MPNRQMMKRKILKYLGIFTLLYLIISFITPFNRILRKRSIENQIKHLSELLSSGYDDQLQFKFPEGKLFSNALLALSIIDYSNNYALFEKPYSQIIDDCIERLYSQKMLDNFDKSIDPKYGIFYTGWTNYVCQKYQRSDLFKYSSEANKIKKYSNTLKTRIINTLSDSMRTLESYYDSAWPADNLVGLLSIEHDSIQKEGLTHLLKSSKHPSGLIHHSNDDKSIIRGSSSAMITYCLEELGYNKIDEYHQKYQTHFIDRFLGIELVKEHENNFNEMDLDSGPIVFGYGASATIMNIKTQAVLQNKHSKITWAAMNCISLPINFLGKKYYLFKQEPMYDLFMLWGSVDLN